MAAYAEQIWLLTCELAPWLLLGAIVAGVMHALLPAGWIERQLSGRLGVAKAVLLGVPLPLCSCGVVPVGLSLKRQGAGVGAAVGFLIATPQTGVDALLVTGPLLGWEFAVFKVVVALVTGLLGGWLADRFAEPMAPTLDVLQPSAEPRRAVWWREVFEHADDLLASIWRWLVLGLLVAAAITTWAPPDALSGLATQGVVAAMLVTLLAALPMYVCATASVPIAAALATSGLPMAAVLVFLMAGPATNAATVAALWRGLGARTTVVYLATIVVGSLVGGVLYDAYGVPFNGSSIAEPHEHGSHTMPWWRLASAAIFGVWMLRFALRDVRKGLPSSEAGGNGYTVRVDGMRCAACVAKLETALRADPQINTATVQLDPGEARVSGPASRSRVTQIIADSGFVARP